MTPIGLFLAPIGLFLFNLILLLGKSYIMRNVMIFQKVLLKI